MRFDMINKTNEKIVKAEFLEFIMISPLLT